MDTFSTRFEQNFHLRACEKYQIASGLAFPEGEFLFEFTQKGRFCYSSGFDNNPTTVAQTIGPTMQISPKVLEYLSKTY